MNKYNETIRLIGVARGQGHDGDILSSALNGFPRTVETVTKQWTFVRNNFSDYYGRSLGRDDIGPLWTPVATFLREKGLSEEEIQLIKLPTSEPGHTLVADLNDL
jgi:hypothetical protein